MKKIISIILTIILTLSMLVGCGSSETSKSQKTEAELRAEIKAEIKVELRAEIEAEIKAELRSEIEAEIRAEIEDKEAENKDESVQEEVKNDLSKGYTYRVDEDILKLTYNNTGNEIVVVKPNIKTDDLTKWIAYIGNVNKSYNEKRLYFETPTWATTNAVHYVDLETLEVNFFTDGWFKQNIGKSPYTNSVIIYRTYLTENEGRIGSYFVFASTGELICELGKEYDKDNLVNQIEQAKNGEVNNKEDNKLSGFTDEIINETQVKYEEYVAVVIPMYSDLSNVNNDKLTARSINVGDDPKGELSFAVFGKVENLKILHTNHVMNEEYTTTKVGNIENALVTIKTTLPTDFSNVVVQGIVKGEDEEYHDISFNLDDMRDVDVYQPIMIK